MPVNRHPYRALEKPWHRTRRTRNPRSITAASTVLRDVIISAVSNVYVRRVVCNYHLRRQYRAPTAQEASRPRELCNIARATISHEYRGRSYSDTERAQKLPD